MVLCNECVAQQTVIVEDNNTPLSREDEIINFQAIKQAILFSITQNSNNPACFLLRNLSLQWNYPILFIYPNRIVHLQLEVIRIKCENEWKLAEKCIERVRWEKNAINWLFLLCLKLMLHTTKSSHFYYTSSFRSSCVYSSPWH